MKTLNKALPSARMVLGLITARDLMTPNPMSIRQNATVSEAASFLTEKGIRAAPVIDEAGRPVGVLSSTDILIHLGQGSGNALRMSESQKLPKPDFFSKAAYQCGSAGPWSVRDIMTPGVFCVRPETSAGKLIDKMTSLKVRRLFVVDLDEVLIGVVSAFDVLRKLQRSCFRDG